MHKVGQALLRDQGLHDVLVCAALGALVRLDVESLQGIMLAQPRTVAHLHAHLQEAGRHLLKRRTCC